MAPNVCKFDVKCKEHASFVTCGFGDERIGLREKALVLNVMYIMSKRTEEIGQVSR